jgi:predicted helicase
MGSAAQGLIEEYKFIDGKHFGEKKHWLHDDYVKFIAFAQKKMDEVQEGVVGIISNHSWLDNPTFRGMRRSLMLSFQTVFVIDLHGNAKKKEVSPDGTRDENVFDIEQGVAISLFVKNKNSTPGVFHAELWGSRQTKYVAAARGTLASHPWRKLEPDSPNWLFIPQSAIGRAAYNGYTSIASIFNIFVTGIVTARDGLVVGFSHKELKNRFDELADDSVSDEEIRQRYKVGDNYQWKLKEVRKTIENETFNPQVVFDYNFRPFDNRKLYNDSRLVFRPRLEVMREFSKSNLGLVTTRITKDAGSVFCTEHAIAHKCASTYDISYVFPLKLTAEEQKENLSSNFRVFLDDRFDHHYTPEEVLGYLYAILYAPTYRARYAEFLRIDFPRVPFPTSADDFEELSELGWELVQAHLLRQLPRTGLAKYHGKGDHTVETARYSTQELAMSINETQFFKPIPLAVWDFHIGGYQVLDKYLRSRKGRKLSLDEINHVAAVADSLAFTIEQMAKIDSAYNEAFPDRG